MAMFEPDRAEVSKDLLRTVFAACPEYEQYGGLTLLHNLSFLKSIATHSGQGNFLEFVAPGRHTSPAQGSMRFACFGR